MSDQHAISSNSELTSEDRQSVTSRQNRPTYKELWDRCRVLDDMLCDHMEFDDSAWKLLGFLRTGTLAETRDDAAYCPECGHINALGHACAMWDGDEAVADFWQPSADANFPPGNQTWNESIVRVG